MTDQTASTSYSPSTLWDWYRRGGDILVYLAISLSIAIFVGQEKMISRGDVAYWLLVGPALLMPLLRVRQTIENLLLGVGRPIAAFGILSGAWFLLQRDFGAIPPIFLIVWEIGRAHV